MKTKYNSKIFLSILFLLSLFLFSACGEDIDCSKQDTKYLKYKLDEETKKCVISQEIPKDECGNGVTEDGESYCNCPDDVDKMHPKYGCDGELGEYLEKSCNEFTKECAFTQNKKVVEETKSLEFKNSDLTLSTKVIYNSPFILNTAKENSMKFDIELLKFGSTDKKYKNILIKDLRIEDSSSNVLANIEYNENLANLGSKLSIKEVGFADTKKYDTTSTLKLKLVISYSVDYLDSQGYVTKTVPKVETLISSIPRFKIINPNFYEEKK